MLHEICCTSNNSDYISSYISYDMIILHPYITFHIPLDYLAYEMQCIMATCSSTYRPVRTSQEAHSVSIK
jgi:hypothetical protein